MYMYINRIYPDIYLLDFIHSIIQLLCYKQSLLTAFL